MKREDQFHDLVKDLTEWWNSQKGTTCEFSTRFEDIEKKMEILSMYKPDNGNWCIHYCETCKRYDESRPLHVMIWKAM